ncbi:tetratricopeptide repeat protein [Methylocella sp.]|uniref:tetratricopeptide repeat protein n=1 Tax=Methylocella sp. TaxID=1978226 RepID=UPI0037833B66
MSKAWRIGAAALMGLAVSLPLPCVRAFGGALLAGPDLAAATGSAAPAAIPDRGAVSRFGTPRAALVAGLEDFRAGASDSAIAALKYAAAGGETLARWKLATIYAAGEGVPHDDLKAYEYFSQIVENYDEDGPNWRDRSLVANAFVALGAYSLSGIEATKVTPDPARALALFKYAAANFGDSTAQYRLARMYLEGAGGDKDSRQGVRWLYLAADKGHVQAQALLGRMLFSGEEGLRPDHARALMWMTLAREATTDSAKDAWIVDLYDKSLAAASESERQTALAYLEDHLKRRN